jgi:protocatechuate 3,4-dioxygenase beta subunit
MSSLFLSLLFVFGASGDEPPVTVSGKVVDADGQPVVGAEVFLSDGPLLNRRAVAIRQGNVPAPPNIVGQAISDHTGTFTIGLPDEVPENDWARTWLVLWVRYPGSALTTYLIGRDWPAHAATVEVRLARVPELSLVVVGADDKPLPNALVLPERVNDVRPPRELAEQLAATTDEAGRTVLRGLDLASLDLVRIETQVAGVQWAALPAANADGSRRITLAPVGTLRGRVTADDPSAVSAVKIRLATWLAAGDDLAGGGLAEVVTDAEGRFEVPAIAAGALSAVPVLHAELPFRCRRITGRRVAQGVTNELTINLERAVQVEGVVRDRDSGQPLAGAAIWVDFASSPNDDPRSDEQGRYRGWLLPGQATPSPWRMPRHYYFPQYVLDGQPVPEGAALVELKPLLLARGVTVRGRVADRGGNSVTGAEIEAHWELAEGGENSLHARSDRDGNFTLDGVDPKVQLKLSAWSANGTTGDVVTVNAASEKPLKLVVDPSHAMRLAGRVVNAEQRPVVGAIVRVAWQRRGAEGRAEDEGYVQFGGGQRLLTDASGRFKVPAMLARGREYRVEVVARGMLPATSDFIDPARRKKADVGDLVLLPIPKLRVASGRILDGQGKPVAGLRVFQTGDGPRRTETTTDEQGQFQLPGLNLEKVFLLASGDGYPLQGFLTADDAKPVELTVRRDGEPAQRRLQTLDEPLTPAERRAIALRLVEPLAPSIKQLGLAPERINLMGTLAVLDPSRASEFSNLPLLKLLGLGDVAEQFKFHAAAAMLRDDLDEALASSEAISTPHFRGQLYLKACDTLPDSERARKQELLATALVNARAERDVAQQVDLMGQIAERWLDLGEIERGTALLREGQKLAEQLPAPSEAAQRAHDEAAHLRAYFAGPLARIDGPAAIQLSAGFGDRFADRYRIVVARGLAASDPAAAARVLDELDYAVGHAWQALAVLHRMAGADPHRAAQLARKCDADNERGYALGVVAHGVAPHDAALAESLLKEAYDCLDRASASGVGEGFPPHHPAVLAAALLPVAERIDPALVEPYLWRAMALRSPRAALSATNNESAAVVGALAIFISRYDRDAARALVAPLAAHAQTMPVDEGYWGARFVWASLAVVDANGAESLIASMPEPSSPLDLHAAKNVARQQVAETLAPSPDTWWHKLYKQVSIIHDPDARDDER